VIKASAKPSESALCSSTSLKKRKARRLSRLTVESLEEYRWRLLPELFPPATLRPRRVSTAR
jgi:hypothetical protein